MVGSRATKRRSTDANLDGFVASTAEVGAADVPWAHATSSAPGAFSETGRRVVPVAFELQGWESYVRGVPHTGFVTGWATGLAPSWVRVCY